MLSRTASLLAHSRRLTNSSTPFSSSVRLASTLVVSEPLDESGMPSGQTRSTVTAATQLGQSVDLLVVGPTPPSQIPVGVTNVYHVPFDDKLAESTANAIQHVAETKDCNIVLGTSTKFGSTVIPRAAALLDVSPITDILEIHDESKCNYTSELYHTHIYIHHSFTQSFFYKYYVFRYIRTSNVCWKCHGQSVYQGSNQTKSIVSTPNQL